MPLNWIRRTFLHKRKKVTQERHRMFDAQQRREPDEISSLPGSSEAETGSLRFKRYSSALDTAFFAWLFERESEDAIAKIEDDNDELKRCLSTLDQHILKPEHLPRRPASLPMLIRLTKDEDIAFEEINRILLSDPSLTDKILKTANTPIFRHTREPLTSIDQAVRALGLAGIRRVVSNLVMQPMIRAHDQEERAFSERTWQWAQMTASASDQYGQSQGHTAGTLYLIGLLPALAFLLVYRFLRNEVSSNPTLVPDPSAASFENLYRAVVKRRAWKLCRQLREQWGLPEEGDKLLLDAKRAYQQRQFNPIRDGMVLASHQVLETQSNSPIEDEQVFVLTSVPSAMDKRVLDHLRRQSCKSGDTQQLGTANRRKFEVN